VSHTDDCVQREDVPFYCPACDVRIKKEIRLKMSREKSPKTPRQPKQARPKKTAKSGGSGPPRDDGIRLKISIKRPAHPAARSKLKTARRPPVSRSNSGRHHKHRALGEDDPAAAGDSDDSMNGRPLIIDEIVPRSVKVGRIRRSSQRLGGPSLGEEHPTSLILEAAADMHPAGRLFPNESLVADEQLLEERRSSVSQPSFVWREEDELVTESVAEELNRKEEAMETRDEEELWLAAVEEGNLARLESVDSELRYRKSTNLDHIFNLASVSFKIILGSHTFF
jgi:hypothetical protein